MNTERQEEQKTQAKGHWEDAETYLRRVSAQEDVILNSIPEELSHLIPHSSLRPDATCAVNLRKGRSNSGEISRAEKTYTGRF